MRFSVVTLFPEMLESVLAASLLGKARAAGLLAVDTVNPRDLTTDRHRTVDDTPYGGGPGMVMKPEPLIAALASLGEPRPHRILLSPTGAPLTQARVRALAARPHLALVCGRYEGIDQRVADLAIDETLSLGDFVLSGGELAALALIDAVARLIPGVLGAAESAVDESFSDGLLEYPQYTRPVEFAGRRVPEVLLGGNHGEIARWRRAESLRRTARLRPDLLAGRALTAADRELVAVGAPAPRCYVALLHYPVRDRAGAVVTTSFTNLDLHDLARSAATYDLGGTFVASPVALQREQIAAIAATWRDEAPARPVDHRAAALGRLQARAGLAEIVAELEARHGARPLVVATAAERTGARPRLDFAELQRELWQSSRACLLVFGTGWGLADEVLDQADHVLTAICGASEFNHLSVRSAVAVVLDRLFGLRAP